MCSSAPPSSSGVTSSPVAACTNNNKAVVEGGACAPASPLLGLKAQPHIGRIQARPEDPPLAHEVAEPCCSLH